MLETEQSKDINEFLLTFGINPNGEPMFRLVWSDDARELRMGTFNEFYGEIFIRTVKGVREVPKYPYLKQRWILEQWIPPDLALTDELPLSNTGSFEPIYVFESAARVALPLNKRVVEIIMYSKFAKRSSPQAIASRIKLEMENLDAKEQEYFEDAVDTNALLSQFHHGEAILNPKGWKSNDT